VPGSVAHVLVPWRYQHLLPQMDDDAAAKLNAPLQ
jgi:hypothetical protein